MRGTYRFSVMMIAGVLAIARVGASAPLLNTTRFTPGSSTKNQSLGMLSAVPTMPVSPLAMNSIQPGMDAASKILKFQPQVPKFQLMSGLAHSDVNSQGVWNGVGQMPNAFWAPWEIQYQGSSMPFDYRINTPFYSETLGPLSKSTDGSTLPWEFGLPSNVASVSSEQSLKLVNMDSASQMRPTVVAIDPPDLTSLRAR